MKPWLISDRPLRSMMTIWSATCRRGFLGALSSGSKRETSPSWASRAVWIADQVVLRASSSAAPRSLLSPWDAGSVAPSDAVARLRAREAGLARALACDPSASWADRSAAPRALQASTAAFGSGASARGTSMRVCPLDSTVPPISCFSQSWPQPERAPAATADSSSMARRLGAVPTRAVHVDGGRRCSWMKPALVGRPGQGEESPGRTVLTSARGRLRQSFRHAGSEEAEEAPSDRSRAGTEPISVRN